MAAPALIGLLGVMLGQDVSWDLRNYHWYNAYAFVNGRYGFDLMPSQIQFFFNPLLDVPFYLLASHVPPKLAFFVLGCVQGLNFVLLFMLAHMMLDIPGAVRKVAACAALAGMGMLGGMGISEIGTVFNDNVTSLGILLSALLVVRGLPLSPLRAGLCGLPAGLMAGLKLTVAPFSAGLCLALLFLPVGARRNVALAFAFGCGALAGFLAAYGHWGLFLWRDFGSPMFPVFNAIFRSPYYSTGYVTTALHTPKELFEILAFPFLFGADPSLVNEAAWRDWRIPALYALVLLPALRAFFGAPPGDARRRYLLVAVMLAYVLWLAVFRIYRYLLPLEMLAPLLIVFCIGALPWTERRRAVVAFLVLLALAATVQPADWGRKRQWSRAMVDFSPPPLPPDAMLLMVAEGQGMAYLLPAFPPGVPAVNITHRRHYEERGHGLYRLIDRKIREHRGPFALLMPDGQEEEARRALGDFGLLPGACQKVPDGLHEEGITVDGGMPAAYQVCAVEKGAKRV